jgi:transcriptional regulator of arginine metabolism
MMKSRDERIELIRKIISGERVSSQDELQLRLKEEGYDVTQATLSRDLKFMKVIKVSDSEIGYIYRLSEKGTGSVAVNNAQTGGNYLAANVVGINFSGNLGVLKTSPGNASSVAIMIDKANAKELLGTIAGDDTVLLIMREGVTSGDLMEILKSIVPGLL